MQQSPWKLAKDPAAADVLDLTLYTAAEALRIATALLAPVMPESTAKIWTQLGMEERLESVRLDALTWGQLQAGQKIGEVAAVFPRIDLKEAVGKMRALEAEVSTRQAALLGKKAPPAMAKRYSCKRNHDLIASTAARQMRARLLRLFFPFREGFVTPSPPRVLTLDVEQELSHCPAVRRQQTHHLADAAICGLPLLSSSSRSSSRRSSSSNSGRTPANPAAGRTLALSHGKSASVTTSSARSSSPQTSRHTGSASLMGRSCHPPGRRHP